MKKARPNWIRGSVCYSSIFAFYLVLSSKITPSEVAAAFGVAGAGTGLYFWLRSRIDVPFRFKGEWLGIIVRRIPLKIFSDCGWVLLALWRYAAYRSPIEGRIVSVPFDPGGEDAFSAARRALVLALVSLTPNTVSITVDREKQTILVHQLVATGEKPGGNDREWPI